MNIKYVNSNGKEIGLTDYPYLFQEGDIIDYNWDYDSENGKIKRIYKNIVERKVNIKVLPDFSYSASKRKQLMSGYVNDLCDFFETDIVNNKDGKLYFDDDYYLNCKLIASSKSDWQMGIAYMNCEFTLLVEYPFWIKEERKSFLQNDDISEMAETDTKLYGYHYPYVYGTTKGIDSFYNPSIKSSNFRLVFYGPVSNPQVMIGDNLYGINITINAGEYAVIDSMEEKMYLVDLSGTTNDIFNKRIKGQGVRIYEKIPSGVSSVNWSSGFGFDLIVYDERSEPKWH